MLTFAKEHYAKGEGMLKRMFDEDAAPDDLLVMTSFWFWFLHHWRDSWLDRLAYRPMIKRLCNYFRKHNPDRFFSSSAPRTQRMGHNGASVAPAYRITLLARIIA